MTNDNQRAARAEQLLDCMDGISDCFLNQAMLWRERGAAQAAARSRKRRRTGWIAAAVAGVLVLTAVRIALLVPLLGIGKGDARPDAKPPLPASLSESLSAAVENQTLVPVEREQLDYFEGRARLCVGDRETGQLYVSRPLTQSEQALLGKELDAGSAARAPRGESEPYSVWILCGDGYVISPCLDTASGCIGAGTLFDYSDERVPTEAFRQLVQMLGT